MKPADSVSYALNDGRVMARVITVHKDSTVSIRARFFVDASGRQQLGYLGYRYRVAASILRLESVALPVLKEASRKRPAGTVVRKDALPHRGILLREDEI